MTMESSKHHKQHGDEKFRNDSKNCLEREALTRQAVNVGKG